MLIICHVTFHAHVTGGSASLVGMVGWRRQTFRSARSSFHPWNPI